MNISSRAKKLAVGIAAAAAVATTAFPAAATATPPTSENAKTVVEHHEYVSCVYYVFADGTKGGVCYSEDDTETFSWWP